MKMARHLSVAMLGLFAVATGAVADPDDNSFLQTDPDGIPWSITHPRPKQLSPEQIQAIQKQADLNRNWLLRNYEQQLHARAAADPSEDSNANFFYQLSSNKDLAKLAGLPALDLDNPEGAASFRTGATPSGQDSVTLRTDASSPVTGGSLSHGDLFKPLITPLGEPEAAGLRNFYSTQLPVSMASPLVDNLSHPSAAPREDQSQDSLDIETPGMVAAKADPLMDSSTSDLSLDLLPGESVEQAKAREESNNELELPLPMDAAQLHKKQAGALNAPSVPGVVQTATPAPAKTVPTEDPNAPMPVSKTPQISPVRGPIANPYDILDR